MSAALTGIPVENPHGNAVSNAGATVADYANGPRQRVQPYPETVALLEMLGSKNSHKCVSC